MTGFAGRQHTPETKARIGAARRGRSSGPRAPITEETRAKQRAAKLGRRYSPEHCARISEGLRDAHAQGSHPAHGYLRELSDGEREDYRTLLRVGKYRRAEALRIVGRADLVKG